jgi:hypothetical protein
MALGPGDPAGAAESGSRKLKAAFLSHSSEDERLASELCASLEARGFPCWIAPRDIAPGQPYPVGILQGIAASQSLVLLASEGALGSVQVLSEVEQAHKRAKPIYTVLIPPAKVRGEMDFYLSRLHWMDRGGRSAEQLAAKLAAVLGRERDWDEVASPPTLRRTMHYRPLAFGRLVAAVVLGLAVVFGGATFAVNRMLDLDYLRLGYVVLAAEPADGGRDTLAYMRIWVMAKSVRFADVRLRMAVETTDGKVRRQELPRWPAPEQVGMDETVTISVGPGVRQLTTCLIVPNNGLNAPYRVTQRFVLKPESGEIRVAEAAEKRVSKEDSAPCGS